MKEYEVTIGGVRGKVSADSPLQAVAFAMAVTGMAKAHNIIVKVGDSSWDMGGVET